MPRAIIIFASLTGSTEEVARILESCLRELACEVEVIECEQTDASVFLEADICVVATYTFGSEGDLPDEIQPFFEDLGHLDLSGKIFGVLGTGEEAYGYFCKSVDDFDQQFEKTGAIRGADAVKVEDYADEIDSEHILYFAEGLMNSYLRLKDRT